MLKLIGIGLKLKDLTLEAIEEIKNSDIIYLETYTSLGASVEELESYLDKKIEKLDRTEVESNKLVNESKNKDVALLVYGDVFSATTHLNFLPDVENIKIVNGLSILTAIGKTGLSLYNFGKVVSIPFSYKEIKSPIENLNKNLENELHTLFLLDLDPKNNKFLNVKDALNYLKENNVKGKVVVCCALGTNKEKIKYGEIDSLVKDEYNMYPQCLIVPGKMHFMEEDCLKKFK
jgi:diphthine synthase